MRVLVTGGAGYVGSHCCKILAEMGFEPVVFDNLSTGRRALVRWGPLIEGDMRDGEALRAAIRQTRPIAVMHFAALSLVGESTAHPGRYYAANVGGAINLLQAMRSAEVDRVVLSSSCAVYGLPDRVPIAEDQPLRPVSPYGETKRIVERMMEDFDHAYGIRSMRLRYFNAAGADPDGETGEWHDPETHLIPLVFDAALGHCPAVSIYGTDYPTEDGTAVRDYVHVMDLALAHAAALLHLLRGGASDVVNLGAGRGTSVREVIRAVEKVTGRRVPVCEAPRRAGDPAQLIADPRRAASLLSWRAKSDLTAMIEDAWRWHSAQAAARTAPRIGA